MGSEDAEESESKDAEGLDSEEGIDNELDRDNGPRVAQANAPNTKPIIQYPSGDVRGTCTQLSPSMARHFPAKSQEQLLQSQVHVDGPVAIIVTRISSNRLPKNWNEIV